jgi:hypothetical protein
MGIDRYRHRSDDRWDSHDWELRRRERDSWTDVAYLIAAGLALVLVLRLWSRVIQPWAAGLLAQLSVTDLVAAVLVLILGVVVVVQGWVSRRRRRAARGLRVVDVPRHIGATDPMASGRESPAQRPGPGWP